MYTLFFSSLDTVRSIIYSTAATSALLKHSDSRIKKTKTPRELPFTGGLETFQSQSLGVIPHTAASRQQRHSVFPKHSDLSGRLFLRAKATHAFRRTATHRSIIFINKPTYSRGLRNPAKNSVFCPANSNVVSYCQGPQQSRTLGLGIRSKLWEYI